MEGGEGTPLDASWAMEKFEQSMEEDLDTAVVVAILQKLAEATLEAVQQGRDIQEAQELLREMGWVFGMQLERDVDVRVEEGWVWHLEKFRN